MSRDQGPVIPSKFNVVFRGRRCAAYPNSPGYPATYTSTVNVSDLTATDSTVPDLRSSLDGPNISPGPGRLTRTVRDAAVALYAGSTDPTNKGALDALAQRYAQDWIDWQLADQPGDTVVSGIIVPEPNGLIDTIEWAYAREDSMTRLQSPPFNISPDELHHFDPATAQCTDAHNSTAPGLPVGATPQFDYYAPPESCIGGGATATATVADGKVTAITITAGGTYTGTPTVCFSEDGVGSGAEATATISGGLVTTVAVTNGGQGYSSAQPPIVSFYGGGSSLQRTRKRMYFEAGRWVPRFVAYETIQS